MAVLLVVALVIAAAVVLYVAFPRRGADVPHAPWLGDALKKGVEALPTIDNTVGRDAVRR